MPDVVDLGDDVIEDESVALAHVLGGYLLNAG